MLAGMLRDVVGMGLPGVAPFELGVVCEGFGVDRSDQNLPCFDFDVIAAKPGKVTTNCGFTLDIAHGLDRAATADLVAVPAFTVGTPIPPAVIKVLRATIERGARVLSVCS